MSLVWTTEMPTEEGWYWYEYRSPIGLYRHIGRFDGHSIGGMSREQLKWVARWAGPIPVPTKPADQDNGEGRVRCQ